MKKKLYIIPGISGAIGNAFLIRLANDPGVVVYGISRKAEPYTSFVQEGTGKFPLRTFICSLGELDAVSLKDFVRRIDMAAFESVVYVHALGHYPFEVSVKGEHLLTNDHNSDGINDLTYDLTYRVFTEFTAALKEVAVLSKVPMTCMLFGSITDKYRLKEHQSWWKVIVMTRAYMERVASSAVGMHLVNISSVICSHELATRPYVFIDTDADPRYWLDPSDLALKVIEKLKKSGSFCGFQTYDIYNPRPGITAAYFSARTFKRRKMAELFGSAKK
jgi:hypothetical protein